MCIETEMTHVITGQYFFCMQLDGWHVYISITNYNWIFMIVLDDSSSNQPGIGWNRCNSSFLTLLTRILHVYTADFNNTIPL